MQEYVEFRSYVSTLVLVVEKAVDIELDKAVVNHTAKTIAKVKGCLDALEIDAGLLASDDAACLLDRGWRSYLALFQMPATFSFIVLVSGKQLI